WSMLTLGSVITIVKTHEFEKLFFKNTKFFWIESKYTIILFLTIPFGQRHCRRIADVIFISKCSAIFIQFTITLYKLTILYQKCYFPFAFNSFRAKRIY